MRSSTSRPAPAPRPPRCDATGRPPAPAIARRLIASVLSSSKATCSIPSAPSSHWSVAWRVPRARLAQDPGGGGQLEAAHRPRGQRRAGRRHDHQLVRHPGPAPAGRHASAAFDEALTSASCVPHAAGNDGRGVGDLPPGCARVRAAARRPAGRAAGTRRWSGWRHAQRRAGLAVEQDSVSAAWSQPGRPAACGSSARPSR